MNFIDKEKNILAKLRETNYAYFDGDKDKAFDFVEAHILTIFGLTPDMTRLHIREIVHDIDLAVSKNEHTSKAIVSINAMNDLSKALGLEPLIDVDTSDPEAVCRRIGEATAELYRAGTNKH